MEEGTKGVSHLLVDEGEGSRWMGEAERDLAFPVSINCEAALWHEDASLHITA